MDASNSKSPLEPYLDDIKSWAEQQWTNAMIVEALRKKGVATSETAVRRAKKRADVPTKPAGGPSFKQDGDEAEIDSGKVAEVPTPEELMASCNLDPEEWGYEDPQIGWWGHPDNRFYSMKLKLYRKKPLEFIFPAKTEGYRPPKPSKRPVSKGPVLWVFPGDQHCPYQSKPMHKAFQSFLNEEKPGRGVLMGDGLDFPNNSRHRDNPEWSATAQECLDGYHEVLCDYRNACEDTEYDQLWGNHCWRLRGDLLSRAERLWGLKPANSPEAKHFLDLGTLLHFDDLGINAIEPNGEYTHAQVQVAPDLIARHGWLTGPNATSKALSGLTSSIIYAHVHSASTKSITRWTPEGEPIHTSAFENGTMCELRGGMGYATDVNWTPCFSAVEVWPDGKWNHEFVRFVGGKLYYRNKRYG